MSGTSPRASHRFLTIVARESVWLMIFLLFYVPFSASFGLWGALVAAFAARGIGGLIVDDWGRDDVDLDDEDDEEGDDDGDDPAPDPSKQESVSV